MSNPKQKQKQAAKLPELKENIYYVWGLFAAFIICVIVLSSCKIEDDDVFWHLATGRFIVENKYVPDKDVFGYTTQNAEWIPFEWGWDVISFSLYNAGGYTALYITRVILFCLIFYLYFLLLRKFKVNSVISIIMLLLLLFAIMDRLSPRPHMFTYLFFVILLYVLLSFKYIDRMKYEKRLYFLPLLFLFWGNLHLGVIAGVMFLVYFLVSELLIFYYPSTFASSEVKPFSSAQIKKLALISLISVLVLLVNPHGIQTYIYAYGHTKMKMLESIQEWLSPFSDLVDSTIVHVLYKVLLFAGLIVLLYAYKKRDLTFAMICLGFALYSVRAVRLGVDYEMIIIFFLAFSLDYYIKNLAKSNRPAAGFLYANPVKIVLAVLLIVIAYEAWGNNLYFFLKYNKQTGWTISENYEPLGMVDFIKANSIKGTPFNNFETGGYQMWALPGEKIFIDSRNLNDEVFNEYVSLFKAAPGFDTKLGKYGIDYAVYFDPRMVKNFNAWKNNIAGYFFRNKGWKLVYWDDRTLLFVKDIPKFADVISKFEYKVFNPYTAVLDKKEFENNIRNNPDAARNEINRKAQTEPQGFYYLGMNDMALKILQGK